MKIEFYYSNKFYYLYYTWKWLMKDDLILVSLWARCVIDAIDPYVILQSSIFSLSISIIGLVVILFEACSYCTIFSTISSMLVANQDYWIMKNYRRSLIFFDRDLGELIFIIKISLVLSKLEKLRACKTLMHSIIHAKSCENRAVETVLL